MTDPALTRALKDVEARLTTLADRQQGMGLPPISRQAPDELVTSIERFAMNVRWHGATHERALTLASLAVCLVASVDRAEELDPHSGEAA